jgi:hypothetical protein
MTPEELNEVGTIVKKLGEFAAERRALVTILNEQKVSNWENRLKEIRETPEYRTIALRYETIFRQMQVDASFEALAGMTQLLNEGKPQN